MTDVAIRVVLVDDHLIVRQGLRALLAEYDDIEVVGEASNGMEAIRQVDELEPNVLLMDLVMPEMDGIEAIQRISSQRPSIGILVITTFSSDQQVFAAIKAGAHGYLLKDAGSDELVDAVRRVYRGEPSLHPQVARKLMQEVAHPTDRRQTPDPLTARELQILKLVANGNSNREIAAQLVVSEVTVRSHISRIFDKIHVANRVQATLYALREGVTSLDDQRGRSLPTSEAD